MRPFDEKSIPMLTPGTILQNRYRIVSLLGRGGMGAVYRAWHLSLNTPIAVKEMVPQPGLDAATLTGLRQQFRQEGAALSALDHAHLVTVLDFFEEGGNAYLVMRLVEGESLAARIKREGALPEDEVLAWADQLLDALEYCHSCGVIHRDIKPQNILIRPDGRAVLVDFGLVKLWDPGDPQTKTVMRGMGTPEYAPPEQYGTQPGHTDPRSDIYSVGATLYHALTGQSPPTASDRTASPELLAPVRNSKPDVSAETERAVLKAMALRLADRFESAAEMRTALTSGVHVTVSPAPSMLQAMAVRQQAMAGALPAARTRKRVPGWVWALGGIGGVAALVLCAALVLSVLNYAPLTPAPSTPAPPTVALTPTPAPTPLPELGSTRIRPADEMVMVYTPAGEFEMGSEDGDSDERPVHVVELDGFWIDKYEVTNRQYALCVAAGACELPSKSRSSARSSYYSDSAYDDYPVIYVSWHQAAAYCAWAGGRLPTESEWEYAARGPEARSYPWGNAAPDCDKANHLSEDRGCVGDTSAVGAHPGGASWCGAQDLAGNVWEWVADWYGPYPLGRQVSPAGPSAGDIRVVRGGSWSDPQEYTHSTCRVGQLPYYSLENLGFRCAMEAETP